LVASHRVSLEKIAASITKLHGFFLSLV